MAGPLFIFVYLLFALAGPGSLLAQESREKIVIAGAASLVPLAEKYSAGFRKEHPAVEVEIRGGGSNFAVEAVRFGKIDVGLVARALDGPEKADLYSQAIGLDAIIVLSYPSNSVTNLSLQQIRDIYQGKIATWKAFGGEEKGIIPLSREKGSALRAIFLDRVFGKGFDGQEKAFVIRASKEKILRTIKRVEGSLGYGIVRLDEAREQGVNVLHVEGTLPTAENIRGGAYPLIRPQLIISKGRPRGTAQEWMTGFARFADRTNPSSNRQ